MRVFLPLVLVVCFFLPLFVPVASAAPPAEPYDDCDAQFIAFIGSSAYQFSPHHQGELGMVRLFTILSYQRAAHEGRSGHAVWQLRIDRAQDGTRALTVDGRSFRNFEGGAAECPVYQRDALVVGERISGPAVIEELVSTTIVHPGDTAVLHAAGPIIIEIGA